MRALTLAVLVILPACSGDDTDLDVSGTYVPFDDAHLTVPAAHVAQHGEISTLRKSVTLATAAADFRTMSAAYSANGLDVAIEQVSDLRVPDAGFGARMDSAIVTALDAGEGAQDDATVAWSAQIVDKSLLAAFPALVDAGLTAADEEGVDQAFGYAGITADGQSIGGVGAVAAGREDQFGVRLLGPMLDGFIEAQAGVAAGDTARLEAGRQEVDLALLKTLALYAVHEIDEIDGTNTDIKLVEARTIWEGVQGWAHANAPGLADAIDGNLYLQSPDRNDGGAWLTADLAGFRDGTLTLDAGALRADLVALVQTFDEE